MLDNLPTRALLGEAEVDRLNGVIHTLLTEMVTLSERVTALEAARGGQARSQAPERIDELTGRVLQPFLR
jgi:hypothetical protein